MKKNQQKVPMNKTLYLMIGLVLFGISSGKIAYDRWDTTDALEEVQSFFQESKVTKNYPSLNELPVYDGTNKTVSLHNNQADFTAEDLSVSRDGWQNFSNLDGLNRVGQANALLTKQMMPSKTRESIRSVYPTGWHQKKIANEVMLYNRSHLIGYQFTGENANVKNLFTGTTELNQKQMRIYEDQIASYIRKTNHKVRYRVTPYFKASELVARGVQIEAKSIEDTTINLNIFIYNIQPGMRIDYQSGYSKID